MALSQPDFAKTFANSLKKWGGWVALSIEDSNNLVTPVSQHISAIYPGGFIPRRFRDEGRQDEWTQISGIARVFLNAFLIQEYDRRTDGPGALHNLLELTESPIEAAFLLALILCGREHFISIVVDGHDPASKFPFYTVFEGHRDRELLIQPQKCIGDYRVDFLLSYTGLERQKVESESPRPEDQWQDILIDKKLIVECDGHDFHERTKQQAARDKGRDRFLQSLGYPVFRFTGSEIFRDSLASAAEVLKVISGHALIEDESPQDKA